MYLFSWEKIKVGSVVCYKISKRLAYKSISSMSKTGEVMAKTRRGRELRVIQIAQNSKNTYSLVPKPMVPFFLIHY